MSRRLSTWFFGGTVEMMVIFLFMSVSGLFEDDREKIMDVFVYVAI